MTEMYSKNEALTKLEQFRVQIDEAKTVPELRTIHQHISDTLKRIEGVRIETIANALGFKVKRIRKGTQSAVHLRVFQSIRESRPDLLTNTGLPQTVNVDALGEDGVYFERDNAVYVPPMDDYNFEKSGRGESHFEKVVYERFQLVKETLTSLGVNLFECDFKYGTVTDEMMRETPYILAVIPKLNRMVLVCDEEGNRTFVIKGTDNREKYIKMKKNELQDDERVRHFIWTSNIEQWKIRLVELLTAQFDESENKQEVQTNTELAKPEQMDTEYFINPAFVKADILAYARELGEDKTPFDITAKGIGKKEISSQTGELVNGYKYIGRAGKALGIDQRKRKNILNKLLEIAGYEVINYSKMDKAYFTDEAFVKADLEAFVQKLGEDATPYDINTKNINTEEIMCQNGEFINGKKYLDRAGRAFGNTRKYKKVIDILLRNAGYEVIDMDEEYFRNPNYVRKDLDTYALEIGDGKSPLDLNPNNITKVEIVCQTHRKELGLTYLLRAGRILGIAKNTKEAQAKVREILDELLKIAGYKVLSYMEMDLAYFTTSDYVRADLGMFARELGINKTPLEISTWNIRDKYIMCMNGERLRGLRYLDRAGVVLGFGSNQNEAQSKRRECLDKLLEIAGYK